MKITPLATLRSTVRSSAESYYLHLAGAQQGPYTIPQIDHLLNSGLIGDETLYWCEGLDQWQPVTSLVVLRKKRKAWVKWVVAAGVLITLAVPVAIFGPVLVEGWQEANQHDFTSTAAYWRARDVVRSELRGQGTLVDFEAFDPGKVMMGERTAEVELSGTSIDLNRSAQPMVWRVPMEFNPEAEEWVGKLAPGAIAP